MSLLIIICVYIFIGVICFTICTFWENKDMIDEPSDIFLFTDEGFIAISCIWPVILAIVVVGGIVYLTSCLFFFVVNKIEDNKKETEI